MKACTRPLTDTLQIEMTDFDIEESELDLEALKAEEVNMPCLMRAWLE